MQFVIFHGAFGSPEGNWFPQLKGQLEDLGQEVIVQQFPVESWNNVVSRGKGYETNIQTLDNWLATFESAVLPKLKRNEKMCFIGHSLGPVFILHVVERFNLQLDSAIFVSPFFKTLPQWEFNAVNKTFYKSDFDFHDLKQRIPVSYVLYSDNDPYVPVEQQKEFAEKLDSSLVHVSQAEHMNSEVNLIEFPLVFDLCTTRLDLSLWQKYLAHRKQMFGLDFFKDRPGSNILFKPNEIMDWQVFLYDNLKASGFCTFYAGRKTWDNNDKYFQEARKAAKRIISFVRIFIVEKAADLKKPVLLEHLQLDLDAGINVYLCSLSDIVDKIPEIDFGVWDNKYLCVVKFNDEKQPEGLQISTRSDDLEKARKWEEVVLKNSVQISNTSSDIERYVKNYKEEVIFLTPEEVVDEGIFKFRHLKKDGFCTFYVPGLSYWNTQSAYLEESRSAATRVGNLTRVYIIDSPKDLQSDDARKQIEADLQSGMKVYICHKEDVTKELHAEPDFGIWDNEYVCIVNFNEKNQATHAKLSSKKEDLEEANMWKKKILEKSRQIENLNQLQKLS